MSGLPLLALRNVHIVCCHPQKPITDLPVLFMIRLVVEFSSSPQ